MELLIRNLTASHDENSADDKCNLAVENSLKNTEERHQSGEDENRVFPTEAISVHSSEYSADELADNPSRGHKGAKPLL